MKRFFTVFAMVCMGLLAGSVYGHAAASPGVYGQPASPAEQAIRPQMAKLLRAANAHDTDAFMRPMVRSPRLVFAINGEVIHGWKALHAQQLQWWNHGKSDARYKDDGAPGYMALGPNVEIVTWPLIGTLTTPAGKAVTSHFVVTYVWQRLPQGWRIVYGHESWASPFD